jgi:uncharacterized protein
VVQQKGKPHFVADCGVRGAHFGSDKHKTSFSTAMATGYLPFDRLGEVAVGLNIEGCRPGRNLPAGARWYNLVMAIDEPLAGLDFDDVMRIKSSNQHAYIEEAVGVDVGVMIDQLSAVLASVAKGHTRVLVHVHQYTGSTVLHTALHRRTGLEVILDGTNFAETPVDYKTVYPDIDALVSISQCAGLGPKAGTWIVPTAFLPYRNRTIMPALLDSVPNGIEPHLDGVAYIKGAVLVVDALWNPRTPADADVAPEGALLLNADDMVVYDFVRESTARFDASHNHDHALRVAYNATRILNTKSVLHLALLHDVCDHKYPGALPRHELSAWIAAADQVDDRIDDMIESVSFSKQSTKDRVDPVLEAVRDGDRIEALGAVGIERCETFTRCRGGNVPEDVVEHCLAKLLRLLPQGFIVTKQGRVDARGPHNDIVRYVVKHFEALCM